MSVAILVFAVLAVLAAWLPIGGHGRLGLAGVVGLAGFGLGVIGGGGGLAALLVLLLLAWRLQPDERAVSGLVFALMALALGFGLLPGFAQAVVFGPEAIKPGSETYVSGVSLGLVAITLLLLAMHPLADRWASAVRAIRLGVGVGLLTAVPALGAGYLLVGKRLEDGWTVSGVYSHVGAMRWLWYTYPMLETQDRLDLRLEKRFRVGGQGLRMELIGQYLLGEQSDFLPTRRWQPGIYGRLTLDLS